MRMDQAVLVAYYRARREFFNEHGIAMPPEVEILANLVRSRLPDSTRVRVVADELTAEAQHIGLEY